MPYWRYYDMVNISITQYSRLRDLQFATPCLICCKAWNHEQLGFCGGTVLIPIYRLVKIMLIWITVAVQQVAETC